MQWECEQADVQKFHIYRSSTPITNSAALPQTKTDIDKKIYYEDIPPVGVYYYAVTSEVDGVEIREVMTNRNTFAEPVRVEIVSITTQDSRVLEKKGTAFSKLQTAMGVRSYKECDVRFKKSLKSYYNNHKYRESIIDLGRIIKADECPADIINRAKLFLGKSYYYDKQYKMAFKCFFDLLKAFPAEADFWLKLTMGKMKDI